MKGAILQLVREAVRAPSGDNTQPWRFLADPENARIQILVDETRDPSPMNSGQRMARIAVGAAAENLIRAAAAQGWRGAIESRTIVGGVSIKLAPASPDARSAAAIAERCTNRKLYDARQIDQQVLVGLREQTPALDGVATHWIDDPTRLAELAALIGEADAMMFGEPSMRLAFLRNVRFDAAPDALVEVGLSLASLELSAMDRIALRTMARSPGWILKVTGAMRFFAAHAAKLVGSSSGLCLIVVESDQPWSDFLVGEAAERAWLDLASRGFAVQPMMSLLVLENALDNGSPELINSLGRERLVALRHQFRAVAPEIGSGRPAFLLRFGHAGQPTGRTGRLAAEASTTWSRLPAENAPPGRN